MKLSDWLQLALNLSLLLVAFAGFASQDLDPLMITALLGMLAALVNGGLVVARSQRREPAPRRTTRTADDLDARQILDLDARLEALEKKEAAQIRALYDEGQIAAPLAEARRQREAQRV